MSQTMKSPGGYQVVHPSVTGETSDSVVLAGQIKRGQLCLSSCGQLKHTSGSELGRCTHGRYPSDRQTKKNKVRDRCTVVCAFSCCELAVVCISCKQHCCVFF